MDLPTHEERTAILNERLRDLRMRHYTLELDKIAANATGAADTPAAIARIEELQMHIEMGYAALLEKASEH